MAGDVWPPVYAHLRYQDPDAAVAWLTRVFQLREAWHLAPDGRIAVARLVGPRGGVILVGVLDDDFRAWMRARVPSLTEAKGRSWPYLTHSTSVMVTDVDAHYEHARAEGASTLTAPGNQPWGMRGYAALDLEGHHWGFGQQLREVEPEQWGATRTGY